MTSFDDDRFDSGFEDDFSRDDRDNLDSLDNPDEPEETREEMLERLFDECAAEWDANAYAAWKRADHPEGIEDHIKIVEIHPTKEGYVAKFMSMDDIGHYYLRGWWAGRSELFRAMTEESESYIRESMESEGKKYDPTWHILPGPNQDDRN